MNIEREVWAVLLAGGAGTRLRGLHADVPKPFIACAGRPFIEWVMEHFYRSGIRRFMISLGHLGEVGERLLGDWPRQDCQIRSIQEPRPLGTAGALRFAEQALPESCEVVLCANADSLIPAELAPVWEKLQDPQIDGVLLGSRVPDAERFGSLSVAGDGRLVEFREKQPGAGIVNAGVYFLKRRVFAGFPDEVPASIETATFPKLLAVGYGFHVHACDAPFLDIGTPESLMLAEAFIQRHFLEQVGG